MGSQPFSPTIPPSLTADMEQLVQQEAVLAACPPIDSGSLGTEVLIHWHDLPAYEDSWESFEVIQTQFPHFKLEDKVCACVTGNDTQNQNHVCKKETRNEGNAK